jgi:fructose-1,6-bisphosphatase II
MLGRLWTRSDDERERAIAGGYDVEAVLTEDDLVSADDCFFACTGITAGQLLRGVTFGQRGATTESLVMRSKSGTVRLIRAQHRLSKLRRYASVDY